MATGRLSQNALPGLKSVASATIAGKVYTAVVLLAFFIPFSYLVDVFLYRMLQRRQDRAR